MLKSELLVELGNRLANDRAISIEHIAIVNFDRCEEWHEGGDPWTLADWGNAVAGEVGELCNVIKKIRRIETGVPGSRDPDELTLRDMMAQEMADVYLYLDLLASHAGIDLAKAIKSKFNAVSEREGFEQKL